jgi:hypothetical protein
LVKVAADTLEEDIGEPLRTILRERATMGATLAGAGVGVVEMQRRLKASEA